MIEGDITYEGLEEVKAALRQLEEALKAGGGLGEMVRDVSRDLVNYASRVTDIITGELRVSHRELLELSGDPRSTIFIDPSAVNPMGERPYEYGPFEHARGGHHAFYARTVSERGPTAVEKGRKTLLRSLPRGS